MSWEVWSEQHYFHTYAAAIPYAKKTYSWHLLILIVQNPISFYNGNTNIVNMHLSCFAKVYQTLKTTILTVLDATKRKHIIQQEMIKTGCKSVEKYMVHGLSPQKKGRDRRKRNIVIYSKLGVMAEFCLCIRPKVILVRHLD